jgi:hypothetical protein
MNSSTTRGRLSTTWREHSKSSATGSSPSQGSPTAINANLNVNAESKELTWDEARDLRRWLDEIEEADDEALEAAAARYRVIVAGRPDLLEKPDGD